MKKQRLKTEFEINAMEKSLKRKSKLDSDLQALIKMQRNSNNYLKGFKLDQHGRRNKSSHL